MSSSNVRTFEPSGAGKTEGSGRHKRDLIEGFLACPACHGGLKLEAEAVRCVDCLAAYPIVDDVIVLVADGNDAIGRRLRARYEATTGGTPLPSVFRITRRLLGDVRGRAVLDVGCSQGQFAFEHLLPAGAACVIGVDFSAGAIREAQRRATPLPNALFVVGDAMALPVQSDRFDRVVITEVIEHLPDVPRCLAELRRVVARDGEIVLSTPNYFNAVGAFKLLFDRLHHGGRERWTYADHSEELEHFQTPFSVRRQLTGAGLSIREFRGSDLWMGIRKALMVPWLLFDHGLRRMLNLWQRDLLSKTFAKYFGVVQYYRLRKHE
jgi:SAM-dependent methyltransferase